MLKNSLLSVAMFTYITKFAEAKTVIIMLIDRMANVAIVLTGLNFLLMHAHIQG